MKTIFRVATILLAATLFGCKPAAPPKSEVRVESASEAARNDDRAIAGRLARSSFLAASDALSTRTSLVGGAVG